MAGAPPGPRAASVQQASQAGGPVRGRLRGRFHRPRPRQQAPAPQPPPQRPTRHRHGARPAPPGRGPPPRGGLRQEAPPRRRVMGYAQANPGLDHRRPAAHARTPTAPATAPQGHLRGPTGQETGRSQAVAEIPGRAPVHVRGHPRQRRALQCPTAGPQALRWPPRPHHQAHPRAPHGLRAPGP